MNRFHDPMYEPEVPEVNCCTLKELLDHFNPAGSYNSRNGARLNERWQKIRSSVTVAYRKWSRSGQNDPEISTRTRKEMSQCFTSFVSLTINHLSSTR